MDRHIELARAGAILALRLARPEKKNALTAAMYAALAEALESAEDDPELRAVVLLGSDGVFCAGNDIKDFLERPPRDDTSPTLRFMRALPRLSLPLIAAVDGPAIGIGATMLLHCDLVYVTTRAQLKMPFVDLATTPEAGSSYLLPRLIGHVRAAELVMLGDAIDGETAVRLGLANRVVAPEALEETAFAAARKLAEKPPEALKRTKRLIKADREALDAAVARELVDFRECLDSAEAREAFSAFLEKRKPDFSRCRETA